MVRTLPFHAMILACSIVVLTACAPTVGVTNLGPNHYTVTERVVQFEPVKLGEDRLVAQAKDVCSRQKSEYHYLLTHIRHPYQGGSYYTIEFECRTIQTDKNKTMGDGR